MAEDAAQERTEQPTQKKLNEAREKGQVARSRELTTMAVLLAASGSMLLLGGYFVGGLGSMMRGVFGAYSASVERPEYLWNVFVESLTQTFTVFVPFFALVTIVALLAPMVLSGWTFSPAAISFKWEKLDPIKGLSKIFAWRGVVELIKALLKFAVVLAVALSLLWNNYDRVVAIGTESLRTALAGAGQTLSWAFLIISCSTIVIALVDVPFQLWDYSRQLRMTRQEIREEFKDTDGNPEIKRKTREIQQEMARRRMMAEVPKADVVITNPTHFAVALKYNALKMSAPIVIAKGRDLVAAHIRDIAVESKVPIVCAPPLSRALYYSTELNHEIPSGLFLAVAQVLAYAYQLKRRPHRRPGEERTMDDLPIPDDLRRD